MEMTGINTSIPDNWWLTATSMNQRTGSEPENASTPGSAEAQECAKAKAGAMVMMPAKKFTNERIIRKSRIHMANSHEATSRHEWSILLSGACIILII